MPKARNTANTSNSNGPINDTIAVLPLRWPNVMDSFRSIQSTSLSLTSIAIIRIPDSSAAFRNPSTR